jgi:hypothetical protein
MAWTSYEYELISFELTTDYTAVRIQDDKSMVVETVDAIGVFEVTEVEGTMTKETHRAGLACQFNEFAKLEPITSFNDAEESTERIMMERKTKAQNVINDLKAKGYKIA